MLKLKVGDKVNMSRGKDGGRSGVIEKIISSDLLAVVPGLNEYKKHVKPKAGQKGGIFTIPRPIVFSKLMLVCPNCSKETRVGIRIAGSEKVRFCKKCNKEIAVKKVK